MNNTGLIIYVIEALTNKKKKVRPPPTAAAAVD